MHRSGTAMAWNVFKFCTALRGLGSIMILLVLGVVGVTYYAVVLTNYGPALSQGGVDSFVALTILVLFHVLLAMLLWSYFSVVFTDPGAVPANWRPASDEERGESDPLTSLEFVGALNYKYFLLFLFYTFLETTLVTLVLMPHFIAFFSDEEIPGTPGTLATTFLAFVLNLAFALSVMGFLIMHISLVAGNTTTIEAYEKKTSARWRYDLGRKKNFEQVFGMDKRYWFIPGYTEEDLRRMPELHGLEYPSKPDFDSQ
ncbi:hypothetical protein HID58_082665 [Brassica napus]|uniref:S-acyltransferase n=1 Tax=Brassica napus TaxID=3708 RepID=A0ABQ7XGZ6_BRANA|nr:hypothetical protein HID58_083957 [Brassica napus]KAH0865454.1 hypothetical protein HID58_082665 [Brassica napus]